MSDDIHAADGRVIGARAQATRRKLLDATAKLLTEQGILDLRVVDISREIGTSPATFYHYFNDVDEAILELASEATEDEKPLVDHLKPGWTEADGLRRAGEFVDAYMTFWDTHHAVLRVRNLKAEEGDRHFRKVRTEANLLLMDSLQDMIREGVAAGRLPKSLDPFTTAAAVVAMCERLLGYQPEMAKRGSSKSTIRDTLATLIFGIITGHV
ncbi:MAG: TetR/AcrR family transcriptional regulator [Ilumatobacteraceae bacterium]|jgi:AcrR family transcriptional regulator|nr:TetR/AcrR family transcriptional regulator [Ilumatobacteraceae bacterium]